MLRRTDSPLLADAATLIAPKLVEFGAHYCSRSWIAMFGDDGLRQH